MKKKIFALLLSISMLLPACEQFLPGLSTSSESSVEKSSSSSAFSQEDSSVHGGSSSSKESVENSSVSSEEDSSIEYSSEEETFSGSEQDNSASSSVEEDSSQNSSNSSSEEENSSQGGNSSSGNNQDQNHKDGNDDGICDDCKASVLVEVDFIGVNDLHGKFADTDSNEGVDELSTYIKQARNVNGNTIVLSSGDMWQGASESNLTKGKIITDWMNEMDFVSMTLGNHEYDWGEEYIKENYELAEFPFLAINIYDNDTNKLVEYCQPSVMVDKGGVQIGIIGAIGNCYSSISGEQSGGFYFKTGSALTELVKAEATKLRAQGADFIVYSVHDDHGEYDYSLSNGYVDLVFEGHTHQDYVTKDSKGVYHLQGGGDNDGISTAEVKINSVTGSIVVSKAEFVSTSTYKNLADDPIVNTLLQKYAEEISLASKELGYNEKYRDSSEILQKCADLYYQAGMERWGDKYQIALGGGFMSARSPYSLSVGTVTYGDLQNILPFDNQLVLCSISGRNLRSKFFETTNTRYYISYGDYGASIKDSIDNNATYYVVTDTYSSTYASNGLTEIARYDEGVFARDLLAKYIEAGGFGTAPTSITYTDYLTIYAAGKALADNATSSEVYYVKGKIISIDNTTYGNFTIQDDNGNTLYVYGLKDQSGNRYDKMSNPPKVGDTVVLQAPVKKYVAYGSTTIELISAVLWSKE